jgi:hypothetical protein
MQQFEVRRSTKEIGELLFQDQSGEVRRWIQYLAKGC